jgi:hypothetical protein
MFIFLFFLELCTVTETPRCFHQNTATAYTATTTANIDGGRAKQRVHRSSHICCKHRGVDGVGGTPRHSNTVKHRVVDGVHTVFYHRGVIKQPIIDKLSRQERVVVIDICACLCVTHNILRTIDQ